jgi:hypothetical protein
MKSPERGVCIAEFNPDGINRKINSIGQAG